MKRYIKVKNRWIDTLETQKKGEVLYQIKKAIYRLSDDKKLGHLQGETDIKEEAR